MTMITIHMSFFLSLLFFQIALQHHLCSGGRWRRRESSGSWTAAWWRDSGPPSRATRRWTTRNSAVPWGEMLYHVSFSSMQLVIPTTYCGDAVVHILEGALLRDIGCALLRSFFQPSQTQTTSMFPTQATCLKYQHHHCCNFDISMRFTESFAANIVSRYLDF